VLRSLQNCSEEAARRGAIIAMGLCLLMFGIAHFFYLNFTAAFLPGWVMNAINLSLTGTAWATTHAIAQAAELQRAASAAYPGP
jgi:hypothetical protein